MGRRSPLLPLRMCALSGACRRAVLSAAARLYLVYIHPYSVASAQKSATTPHAWLSNMRHARPGLSFVGSCLAEAHVAAACSPSNPRLAHDLCYSRLSQVSKRGYCGWHCPLSAVASCDM